MLHKHPRALNLLSKQEALGLFARGYLASSQRPAFVPLGWVRVSFAGLTVWRDPRLAFSKFETADASLLCLGSIFDVRQPSADNRTVLHMLHSALAHSEPTFFEALSWTNGRYVLFFRSRDGEVWALTDATGMKSLTYSPQGHASSHAALTAFASGMGLRSHTFPAPGGWPGNSTPYPHVYTLTPNTRIRVADNHVQRFYPMAPIASLSVEDAARELAPLLRGSLHAFYKRGRLLLSLTAGLDSRTTLAAAGDLSDVVELFTYFHGDNFSDNDVATLIASKLRLRHCSINLSGVAVPSSFEEIRSINTLVRHIPSAAFRYSHIYLRRGFTHVRSNISEIGRAFYWKRHSRRMRLDSPAAMMRVFLRSLKGNDRTKEVESFSKNAFARMMEVSNWVEAIKFVDSRDLQYWEHRMPAWHAQLIIESDQAFDTLSIFNCRRILELMLSPPDKDRQRSTLLPALIEMMWPELGAFPINPETPNNNTDCVAAFKT